MELRFKLIDEFTGEVREWECEAGRGYNTLKKQVQMIIRDFYKVSQKLEFRFELKGDKDVVSKMEARINKYMRRIAPKGVREK